MATVELTAENFEAMTGRKGWRSPEPALEQLIASARELDLDEVGAGLAERGAAR